MKSKQQPIEPRHVVVRRVRHSDIPVWQELSIATFSETFGHLYAESDLENFLRETYSREALEAIINDDSCAVWLAFAPRADAAAATASVAKNAEPSPGVTYTGGEVKSAEPSRGGEGEAIAYVMAAPCALPHPEASADDGEVRRLYVRQGYRDWGLGSRLITLALEWLLAKNPRQLWLGVWSDNYGAQRFYERFGFSYAGEYGFKVGEHRDREFMYRRKIR